MKHKLSFLIPKIVVDVFHFARYFPLIACDRDKLCPASACRRCRLGCGDIGSRVRQSLRGCSTSRCDC